MITGPKIYTGGIILLEKDKFREIDGKTENLSITNM